MGSPSLRPKFNITTRSGLLTGKKLQDLKYLSEKKCPIYVHKPSYKSGEGTSQPLLHSGTMNTDDSKTKSVKKNKDHSDNQMELNDNTTKYSLNRIEESYWSQWKPNKDGVLLEASQAKKRIKPKGQNKQAMSQGDSNGDDSKSNEMMEIGDSNKTLQPSDEKQGKINELTDEDKEALTNSTKTEEAEEFKFLKHTDSFILNSKKQQESKPRYQQPRCIRLYKKANSGSCVRGGSYPLKPCLKKESSFKGYTRRSLSGSPYSFNMFKTNKNSSKMKLSQLSK